MKIVVTGGPGGGKTTALDLFKRELQEEVTLVPESATSIFKSGIKRGHNSECITLIQKMIFDYQNSVEELYEKQNDADILLCDRGTLDGLAYWPTDEASFFKEMKTSLKQELSRYDAVIFFETAAVKGGDIRSNNDYRNEDNDTALALDKKLYEIWSQHPEFHLVKSEGSFIAKIINGVRILEKVVNRDHS